MQAWRRFQSRYPHIDPTDTDPYHKALSQERERYGIHLSHEDREIYSAWLGETEAMRWDMIAARGRFLGLYTGGIDDQGRGYALVGFRGATPEYTFTQNREAAVSTAASFVRRRADFDAVFGPEIDGSGFYVNVNDHGSIYWNTEFRDDSGDSWRLTEVRKNDGGVRDHMTHVAGTIGARGVDSRSLGMAPAVHMIILIQQYNNDVREYGMNWPGRPGKSIAGNTSLGSTNTTSSGVYDSTARTFDQEHFDTPYYQHFYAAANNGSSYFTVSPGRQSSKNTFTVAAVGDVSRNAEGVMTGGGSAASWSSRGPMRDGRIKPDISANGVDLRSPTTTTGYGSKSGTSMASPNAAGSAILLQDYFSKRFPGHLMRAATLKTLIIHTAEDLGRPGPDYIYGWGLMNVLEAGRVIQAYTQDPASRVLVEDILNEGQTVAIPFESTGTEPIRVTLGWTDLAGASQSDPAVTTPALVQDLNLRLIGPDDTVHLPYVMPYVLGADGKTPFDSTLITANAIQGTNFTDNTIRVDIPVPVAGSYTVEISHAKSLVGGFQAYSLAVSGLDCTLEAEPPVLAAHPTQGDNTDFYAFAVTGSGFLLGADVILRRDGFESVTGYGTEVSGSRIATRFDTASLAKGYWDVIVRNPDGLHAAAVNGFLLPLAEGGPDPHVVYGNRFDTASGLTLTGAWAVGTPAQGAAGGPDNAYDGDNVLGTYLDGQYDNNVNITATLPAFSTANKDNITLTFRRWLGLAHEQRGQSGQGHADYGRILYSLNGTDYYQVWANSSTVNDGAWTLQSYVLPAAVNNQPAVYLRLQLETDSSEVSYGWNVDDLAVTGESTGILYPPVFESTPGLGSVAAEAYAYAIALSDADTHWNNLALTAETLPAWLVFSIDGEFSASLSGTPSAADVGPHTVSLKVTDGAYDTWQIFEIQVYPEGYVIGMPVIRHAGAFNVRWHEAEVQATLEEGEAPVRVTLHWGPGDGGTNAGAWYQAVDMGTVSPGPVTHGLSGLMADTVYHYRFFASNGLGAAWAPASSAFATLDYRTLYASAGPGGSIAPAGAIDVAVGAAQAFAIAANAGYVIEDVRVDDVSVGAVDSYTFENVSGNHTLEALFSEVQYFSITANAGEHGAILPAGVVTVAEGAAQTFAMRPDPGYRVAGVLVDDIAVGAVDSYTFDAVTQDHAIAVSFEPNRVSLPYQQHWEHHEPGQSVIGAEGWNGEPDVEAVVEIWPYDYAGVLPALDPPAPSHTNVVRFDTSGGTLSSDFDTASGYTNAVIDIMIQFTRAEDSQEMRQNLMDDTDLQLAYYVNSNGYLTVLHCSLDDANPTNRLTVLDAVGIEPLDTNGWARLVVELDYRTCPNSRKYFRIAWHDQSFFTHAQALSIPNAAEGTPGGAWFLCSNQDTIPDRLRSVEITGTGRLDDYRVAVSSAPAPKQDQTIDFAPIAVQTVTNVFTLGATASSGLPVSFTVTAGPAAITNGTTLSFTGSGRATVTAMQAGDDIWNPAPPVAHAFDVLTEEGFVDANNNGVCDDWEAFYFGANEPPSILVRRGGIKMTLREVFVAGLNPHDDSLFEIVGMDLVGIEGTFVLTFPAATDRVYAVLANSALTNVLWDILINNIVPTGTTMQVTIHDDSPSPQRFYRIQVSLP